MAGFLSRDKTKRELEKHLNIQDRDKKIILNKDLCNNVNVTVFKTMFIFC